LLECDDFPELPWPRNSEWKKCLEQSSERAETTGQREERAERAGRKDRFSKSDEKNFKSTGQRNNSSFPVNQHLGLFSCSFSFVSSDCHSPNSLPTNTQRTAIVLLKTRELHGIGSIYSRLISLLLLSPNGTPTPGLAGWVV
jgi:hypothetical protein